ncbi:hypothetical protein CE91St41_29500 [Oscillospiraceae bacterium]|nr:hypothetical protein CE91St40_29500 [Oscillospiraceae bacterium]BDF76061.1 hypothetical protein CE91St41_29500 [Oscillospiraceae bacterium]
MSWGACYMYYRCPACGKRFKYATDLIPVFGPDFGRCPDCGGAGDYEKDGARTPDDALYEEVE